jgi:type II secretory ATPase GspE/PulE/Tfp pilus assembly ATPase PilB-like protein
MIGEIRDAETAKIGIEAGLTGHLLMSTMHSGTPAGALLRLLEMGIEPYQVTSSVSAVLNQRLIRRLCNKCKKKKDLTTDFTDYTESKKKELATENTESTEINGFEAVGCEECFHTGYKGRMLIAEMVQLDSPLRKAILAKADLDELEQLLQSAGHENMVANARRLIDEGLTTEDELNKVCGIVT